MKKNVDQLLKSLSSSKAIVDPQGLKRLPLRVPEVRAIIKTNFKYDSEQTTLQREFWNETWNSSKFFDSMSACLYFYQHRTLTKQEAKLIIKWIDRCSCWEHSDDLSKIYAQVLEENPDYILPTLLKWNKAKNPWKRRQSLVSLLEYSSKRKVTQPFDVMISQVTNLLGDSEYYVQKGLGWTMREIYNIYPAKMIKFFKKHLTEISPIAYSAATEKLDKQLKKELNLKRKLTRLRTDSN